MLEHTKRQVKFINESFLQHALSRCVYIRSLFDIFSQLHSKGQLKPNESKYKKWMYFYY